MTSWPRLERTKSINKCAAFGCGVRRRIHGRRIGGGRDGRSGGRQVGRRRPVGQIGSGSVSDRLVGKRQPCVLGASPVGRRRTGRHQGSVQRRRIESRRFDGGPRIDRFGSARLRLVVGTLRIEAPRGLDFVLGEPLQQARGGLLQKSGGELVQQPADLVGDFAEQAGLFRRSVAQRMRTRQAVLERARKLRKVSETDRRRAAGERMSERDRHLADRAVQVVRRRDSSSASFR